MGVNQRSNKQQLLSIISVLLSFVANGINDDGNDQSSTKNFQQICVEAIDGASQDQENAKRAYRAYAHLAVLTDWLGPTTIFNDSQFKRVL